MYYLVDKKSKESFYINYYINFISMEDFRNCFELYVTDNIKNDFAKFDKRELNDASGVVILPEDKDYFIALIQNTSKIDTYFHELTHLYDLYKFKNYFNLKSNTDIRSHKYFKTFSLWTEYHARTIELIHFKLFEKTISNDNSSIDLFFDNLIDDYQIKYWNNSINNYNCVKFHDVMWLFAIINIVKKYKNKTPFTPENNASIPWGYYELIPLLEQSETFEDFLSHIDELVPLIAPLPLN